MASSAGRHDDHPPHPRELHRLRGREVRVLPGDQRPDRRERQRQDPRPQTPLAILAEFARDYDDEQRSTLRELAAPTPPPPRRETAKKTGSAAVDFVGLRDGGGELVATVATKVRDTVAGLVGAGRQARAPESATLLHRLADAKTCVNVVLWLEHAATLPGVKPRVQDLRNRARGGVEFDRLQASVRWLGARVLICSRADVARVPGLAVRSVAGAARRTRRAP